MMERLGNFDFCRQSVRFLGISMVAGGMFVIGVGASEFYDVRSQAQIYAERMCFPPNTPDQQKQLLMKDRMMQSCLTQAREMDFKRRKIVLDAVNFTVAAGLGATTLGVIDIIWSSIEPRRNST